MSKPYNAKVRTSELNKLDNGVVDLLSLKAANLIPNISLNAKIFLSGEVTKKLTIQGIGITKGALKAVKDAGGKVEEVATTNSKAEKKEEKKDLVKDKPSKKSK
jgi:large subunit ribosomal protein L15